MRTRRILQILSAIGASLLLLVALTAVISALSGPLAVLILFAATVLAVLGGRVVSRRVPSGTVLEVDLDAGVVEKAATDLPGRMMRRNAVVLRDLIDALARAGDDDRVAGLIARIGNGGLSVAQAQELRDAISSFRAKGKRTVAYSESFGEGGLSTADYYLAAAFEEIHMLPIAGLSIQGVVTRTPFLGGLFDHFGVKPDFDHRREYKAMKYLLTEDHYVPPHEEAATTILEDHMGQIVAGIAADRGLDVAQVREAIDRAPLYGDEAVEAGLVDSLSHRDVAYESARGDGGGFMFHDQYLKRAGRPNRKGERIALIYGTGSINRGSSGFDPLTRGTSMGADDVAKAFREARDDAKVRAIVFRVDSPGGSAVGSEVVYREVVRAREAGKPVVVSMGTVAGSGGYYVAAPADRIVAQPGTLTGSIGVVTGKLATSDAWRKVGLNWGEIKVGRNAGFSTPSDVYSESERDRLEAGLEVIYEGFKSRVAAGRSMSADEVEEVAKGRVWTGERAAGLGLVDEMGGLDRAIDLAKELSDIPADASVGLRLFPRSRTIPWPARKPSSEPVRDLLALVSAISSDAPHELRMEGQWAR